MTNGTVIINNNFASDLVRGHHVRIFDCWWRLHPLMWLINVRFCRRSIKVPKSWMNPWWHRRSASISVWLGWRGRGTGWNRGGAVMVRYFVNGDIIVQRLCNGMCFSFLTEKLNGDINLRGSDEEVKRSMLRCMSSVAVGAKLNRDPKIGDTELLDFRNLPCMPSDVVQWG